MGFLSKGSRPFLFHVLCGLPEGLCLLNDWISILFGRAINMHRQLDTGAREDFFFFNNSTQQDWPIRPSVLG